MDIVTTSRSVGLVDIVTTSRSVGLVEIVTTSGRIELVDIMTTSKTDNYNNLFDLCFIEDGIIIKIRKLL